MTIRLNGQVAIVTGGGQGLGRSHALALAEHGAKIVVNDLGGARDGTGRSSQAAESVVEEIRNNGGKAIANDADVADFGQVEAMVKQAMNSWGRVDILINNAGIIPRGNILETTDDMWFSALDVNLNAAFFLCRAAIPLMQRAGGGAIVNLGSVTWMVGQGGMPGYSAAKSAVVGLTRSLARDLGPDNIRVNSVLPGWIMTERQIAKWLTPEGEAKLLENQCLKRKLYPEDVARAVLFFAADDSAACTNQNYIVDGGWV